MLLIGVLEQLVSVVELQVSGVILLVGVVERQFGRVIGTTDRRRDAADRQNASVGSAERYY